MDYPDVRPAQQAGRDQVIHTISLGFAADPVARWIWPEAKTYSETMPRFVVAFAGKAFEQATAYIAGVCHAAALWLAPGVKPDAEAVDKVLQESVRSEIREDLERLFVQMDEHHPTDKACWYLPMIATDPAHMSQGLGSALLVNALARCDRDGALAYLEATTTRSAVLYRRYGFEIVGEIQTRSSPPIYPMVRRPRHGVAA